MHFKDIKIPREESRNQKKVRPLPDIFDFKCQLHMKLYEPPGTTKSGSVVFGIILFLSNPRKYENCTQERFPRLLHETDWKINEGKVAVGRGKGDGSFLPPTSPKTGRGERKKGKEKVIQLNTLLSSSVQEDGGEIK